jgi:hypothetical protein
VAASAAGVKGGEEAAIGGGDDPVGLAGVDGEDEHRRRRSALDPLAAPVGLPEERDVRSRLAAVAGFDEAKVRRRADVVESGCPEPMKRSPATTEKPMMSWALSPMRRISCAPRRCSGSSPIIRSGKPGVAIEATGGSKTIVAKCR